MAETGRDSMIDTPALNWPELQSVMYWYTGTVRDGETDDLFVDSLLVLFVDNAGCDKHRCQRNRRHDDTIPILGMSSVLKSNSLYITSCKSTLDSPTIGQLSNRRATMGSTIARGSLAMSPSTMPTA